jgi:hypothetical protein
MLVDRSPIHNLEFLRYFSVRDSAEESEIISSLAIKCRSLKSLLLKVKLDSSVSLLKIVECCRGLNEFAIWNDGGSLYLGLADFKAIASLPLLNHLQIDDCEITNDALSPLARCRGLKRLFLHSDFATLRDIILSIGVNLRELSLQCMNAAAVDGVLKCCPNLESLYIIEPNPDKEIQASLEKSLKSGLKRLSFFQVDDENGVRVRLGTDWMGYD